MSVDTRYAHMLVADDIRAEVGNKFSLMGIYDSALLVQSFPATIGKLVVYVVVNCPLNQLFKGLRIELRLNNQPIGLEELSEDAIPVEGPTHDKDGHPYRCFSKKSVFILSPLSVDHPCLLRAHVFSDGEELMSNGLAITTFGEIQSTG